MKLKIILTVLLILQLSCPVLQGQQSGDDKVKVGAEVLIERHLDELKGKRIGLVMNPTARIGETHMLDTLLSLDVNVAALFAPEHGFRGEAGAGEVIRDGVDQSTGLPVYSLYGDQKKPTPEMLEKVDLLLFDMQDVGARFYTYNVTLGLIMEAGAENGVPVWVLDRPNPAGGKYVAGWVLEEEHRSFIGTFPIPMAHGMTLGELAKMMIGEEWIEFDAKPELRVIAMEGWERSMKWPDTGLKWVPPSPNLPTFEHAYFYLGTVLFEGTNISEGRGTANPFLTIGSPTTHIAARQVEQLNQEFPAVSISKTTFTPRSMPGKALNPKFEGEECRGIRLTLKDPERLDPVSFGVRLLTVILENTEDGKVTDFLYKLAGTDKILEESGSWNEEVSAFKKKRNRYLIY